MSTDAIVLLKKEHQEIRKAFRAFENAGERAEKRKGQLVDRIIELLTRSALTAFASSSVASKARKSRRTSLWSSLSRTMASVDISDSFARL